MLRLPVSGERARWRPMTGEDDIALADCAPGLLGALAFVSRSVVDADDRAIDAGALPVGDVDVLVLARRREVRGDAFVAEGTCGHCGADVDVSFSLAAYADHLRPRVPRGARQDPDEPRWWTVSAGVQVRVPTVDDVLDAAAAEDPRALLLSRCVRPYPLTAPVRVVERAMAALGPTLRSDVAGTCPECARGVLLDVDAREMCLADLRFLARAVYDDVHLIASAYGWGSDEILRMPTARRRRFAELIVGGAAHVLEEVGVG